MRLVAWLASAVAILGACTREAPSEPQVDADEAQQVAVAVQLTAGGAELLGITSIEGPFTPTAAAVGDEPAVRWELRRGESIVADGAVMDPRIGVSEFLEDGTPSPAIVSGGAGLLLLRLPNTGGELVFDPAPSGVRTQSVRPQALGGTGGRVKLRQLARGAKSLVTEAFSLPVRITEHEPCGGFNFLIVPDGYTEGNLGKFERDAKAIVDGLAPLFGEKFREMNFYRWNIASADDGIADPGCAKGLPDCPDAGKPAIERRTAFGTSFGKGTLDDARRGLNVGFIPFLAFNAGRLVGVDVTIILANTYEHSGSARPGVIAQGLGPSAAQILAHELGHQPFGLADEYEYGACDPARSAKGLNVTTNADAPPWKDLVEAGLAGVYLGGGRCATGVFRGDRDCSMRDHRHGAFGAVCRRVIDRAFAARRLEHGTKCADSAPKPASTCSFRGSIMADIPCAGYVMELAPGEWTLVVAPKDPANPGGGLRTFAASMSWRGGTPALGTHTFATSERASASVSLPDGTAYLATRYPNTTMDQGSMTVDLLEVGAPPGRARVRATMVQPDAAGKSVTLDVTF
jgi:hypothetical protein